MFTKEALQMMQILLINRAYEVRKQNELEKDKEVIFENDRYAKDLKALSEKIEAILINS